jgi:hypothetical protein
MAGLFAKAAQKAKETVKDAKKKATAWTVGSSSETDTISKAVKELVNLESQSKAIEAKMSVIKSSVKRYGDEMFVRDYVARGSMPETPMTIQNPDGEKVTYVAQDRSTQYAVKPDQQEALNDLLGEDAAGNILTDSVTFGFNEHILSLPGVQDVIEKSLMDAISGMIGMGMLDGDQAELLLKVSSKTTFKPGTLDQLVQICGKDTSRMKQFLDIAQSSFTRYVKC